MLRRSTGASGAGTRGAGTRHGDAQRGTAPHPPGARPSGLSGADADALADADAVARMDHTAHALLWEPRGGVGRGGVQSDTASQAASKEMVAPPKMGVGEKQAYSQG